MFTGDGKPARNASSRILPHNSIGRATKSPGLLHRTGSAGATIAIASVEDVGYAADRIPPTGSAMPLANAGSSRRRGWCRPCSSKSGENTATAGKAFLRRPRNRRALGIVLSRTDGGGAAVFQHGAYTARIRQFTFGFTPSSSQQTRIALGIHGVAGWIKSSG